VGSKWSNINVNTESATYHRYGHEKGKERLDGSFILKSGLTIKKRKAQHHRCSVFFENEFGAD